MYGNTSTIPGEYPGKSRFYFSPPHLLLYIVTAWIHLASDLGCPAHQAWKARILILHKFAIKK